MTEEIREKIADAQMVLVGIGKELEERFHGMEQDAGYVRLRAQAHEGEQRDVLEQYLRLAWLKDHPDERKKEAYEALAVLLSGKNCFVVTLCTDDAVFGAGLDEGRIVAPCGGFRKLSARILSVLRFRKFRRTGGGDFLRFFPLGKAAGTAEAGSGAFRN